MSARVLRRVCVLWARFGPYHLARLRALHAHLDARGVELVGLETAREDATYAWDREDGAEPFARRVALPDGTAATPRAIRVAVRAALDAIDPDAVAIPSYSTPDAQAALAWCRRHRRVAVMLFDSRREDAPRSGWREAIKRAIVGAFDAALVAGTPQAAYARALGIPPSHLFTPLDVVDNGAFRDGADAEREAASSGAPFLLSVNRFTARKNVDGLVRAYALYRQRTPEPWPLVLLGDGPEHARLERLAGDGVAFEGFQQMGTLPSWYGRAGVYVHPAASDPWGLVVNEAMAAGLPVVVSTGAGCAPDLVEVGANGFVFDPSDASALADALVRVTEDAALRARMGRRSREIIARFRPEDFAAGLWSAVQAGQSRADRPMPIPARIALSVLGVVARRADSFHTVDA